jgi:sulfide:quinone oxidoreductase
VSHPSDTAPLRVVIAGAGVAGLEAMMALRALAGPRVDITVLAPSPEFVYRPVSVAEPFGAEPPRRYSLERVTADFSASFLEDDLAWVAARGQRVFLGGGDEIGYDALVVALGARAVPAWPHVTTFVGPSSAEAVRALVEEAELGRVASLAFVVPTGVTWPFPLYELALMTAARLARAGAEADLALFTPEREPLEVFGADASAAVAHVMSEAKVRFRGGSSVEVDADGLVLTRDAERGEPFDRVLAIPRLEGPAPRGLPCDDEGFIPIDAHGMVHRVEHVYAAGDGTDYPVKQGGIATQQADAVAELIAKRAGARVDPRPIRPILRGHMIANGASRFLRAELHHRDEGTSEASVSPLWWPPDKIAGTYLSPYLAQLDAAAL